MGIVFVKVRDVCKRAAFCRSALYQRIDSGEFPKAIKRGATAFWLESELEAMMAAYVREADSDELKALAFELVERRNATPAQEAEL